MYMRQVAIHYANDCLPVYSYAKQHPKRSHSTSEVYPTTDCAMWPTAVLSRLITMCVSTITCAPKMIDLAQPAKASCYLCRSHRA